MASPSSIRIGTRKSPLALAQAGQVRSLLLHHFPNRNVELVAMTTTGDQLADRPLAEIGGKGLFTKELEEALSEGSVDLAVHSLKDMETSFRPGFMLAATLERADARDVFISMQAGGIAELKQGARVGTSSLRRTALLRIMRPDLNIVPFRGNVQTRLKKLEKAEADATLLAAAGLLRLGLERHASEYLDIRQFIPAVGQGTIAIECCEENHSVRDMLDKLNHAPTWTASLAERSLLARLDGSCRTPIAGYAYHKDGSLHLCALIASPDGSKHVRGELSGPVEKAQQIGSELAKDLLARGGRACLA